MTTYVFPGQGSQKKGMGSELFEKFADLTAKADEILGYSIAEMCLEDPGGQLKQTEVTQPALYVVNALTYLNALEEGAPKPDFTAGHSLGEYNALFAAGAFSFETGLKLVKERGRLMSQAKDGGMAAVLKLEREKIEAVIRDHGLAGLDIANLNSPSQIVISGPVDDILKAQPLFEEAGAARYIPLKVSAAFHSRYMEPAREAFAAYLDQFELNPLEIPVIANVTARPYKDEEVKHFLARQIVASVNWTDTVRFLMGKGETEFKEMGPGAVLSGLYRQIKREASPMDASEMATSGQKEDPEPAGSPSEPVTVTPPRAADPDDEACKLGSPLFRERYGVRYAYVAGSMGQGVSSAEFVIRMGKAGLLSYLGTAGLSLNDIGRAVDKIQAALGKDGIYGLNLAGTDDRTRQEGLVDLILQKGVRFIETSGFLQVTPALVRLRLHGASRKDGKPETACRILAKVSRPEPAELMMGSAPARLLEELVETGRLSRAEADLAEELPLADEVCAVADSAWMTDQRSAFALLPAVRKLRDEKASHFAHPLLVGAAGGIGTPDAAAAAFLLGADFILTGSINQATVEAATSDAVKDMLVDMNVQDTAYAPASDWFEMGGRVQVLKRGVFFPVRAEKLHALYQRFDSLNDIDAKTKAQVEDKYFRKSFDDVWQTLRGRLSDEERRRAEENPKHKMALVFKWYLAFGEEAARSGNQDRRVDYQIYCGPALGAFNQWVKGSELADWRGRHVDTIADKMMAETVSLLKTRIAALNL